MRIAVIDNYDSFTYNLVYILRQESEEVEVFRNDKITPQQCLAYDAIVLSPGPGIPENAGNLSAIIATCAGKVPLFGVCLGHQAIAEYLGGKLRILDKVYHGVQSAITLNAESRIFQNLPQSFQAGRYHSWDVATASNPNFEITAVAEDKSIMAIQNIEQNLYGIQFHPESVLTPEGILIVQNFLSICRNQQQ
ncbi:anthranilate synthase component II [Haloflavibacter putidus]|uniref:Aminodeoxychorismate/anthranilate synthase component II n=1 Tax=Haloflavibacter putidus TaxID=2576776 RepID=A0A507ZN40_9FLAO|nr:aminodeoxychorismate/anthranilate synthase component II [Haloflavibacter putidus]TQD37654.1 aminodeoxychorismate/anthranilate synthase component II [Haloflavibacter putidus]